MGPRGVSRPPARLGVAAGPSSRTREVAAASEAARHPEAAWAARSGRRGVARGCGAAAGRAARSRSRFPEGSAGRGRPGAAARLLPLQLGGTRRPGAGRRSVPGRAALALALAAAAAATTTGCLSRRAGVAAEQGAPWAGPGVGGDPGAVAALVAGSKPGARPSGRRRFAPGSLLPAERAGLGLRPREERALPLPLRLHRPETRRDLNPAFTEEEVGA